MTEQVFVVFFFKPISKVFFWWFVFICMLLMWTGGKPIESPYLLIGQISTFSYFGYLLLVIPFFSELHLLYNRYRLYHPVSFDLQLNNFFTKSYKWFTVVVFSKGDLWPDLSLGNDISDKFRQKNNIISSISQDNLTDALYNTMDVDLLLELDTLQASEIVEPLVLNTPTLAVDIEEYKKWSSIVNYMHGLVGRNDLSLTIDFLSKGLDLPLSEKEHLMIKTEGIDLNLYKIAKQYKFYKNILHVDLSSKNPSAGEVSNIFCFLLEEAQHKTITTGFDDLIINFFRGIMKKN